MHLKSSNLCFPYNIMLAKCFFKAFRIKNFIGFIYYKHLIFLCNTYIGSAKQRCWINAPLHTGRRWNSLCPLVFFLPRKPVFIWEGEITVSHILQLGFWDAKTGKKGYTK